MERKLVKQLQNDRNLSESLSFARSESPLGAVAEFV